MIRNIIANYISRFFSLLSNFLFIPLYIKFLGIEDYSIISFSLAIVGIMIVLDAGLTVTLSKEFASKRNSNDDKTNIFSTLETCYLLISAFVILSFFLFSNTLSHNWLNLKNVSPEKVNVYLRIIGIGTAFQLLSNFYNGGLLGLEKQIKANAFLIGWGIVRNGLVIIPLIFYPSLYLFFGWQAITTIIYVIILRYSLRKILVVNDARFWIFRIDKAVLRKTWRFAGGILLISIVAAVNSQMDKLAISKLLPIEILGFYTLAYSMAQIPIMIVNPVAIATLPRFTSLFSENRNEEAVVLFERTFKFTSILVFSISSAFIIFSRDLIWIWTNSETLSNNAALFVPYLTIGTGMIALQILPYNIALSNSYTRLNNIIGISSLILTIPGYWIMTSVFGPIGAAITMAVVQFLITFVYLYFINRLFLHRKSYLKIFVADFILPFLISITSVLLISYIPFSTQGKVLRLCLIAFSLVVSVSLNLLLLLKRNELRTLWDLLPLKNIYKRKVD